MVDPITEGDVVTTILACAEVDEAGEEKGCEYVEEPIPFAEFTGGEMQYCPGDDAKAESVGDGVGERNKHQREESGNGDQRLCPADLSNCGQHEGTDKD